MKTQTKFKQTEIGKIPEDWEETIASEFCAKVTDGTHDSPKKRDKGKYLITSRHIKEGKLDFANAYFISEEDFEDINKRSKVNRWDLIFGMIGTIGEIYLEKEKNPDYAIKNVGLFKTDSELKSKWLFYFLKSPFAKDYIFRHSAGTTQQYMTLGSLRNFPVASPKNENEMKSIASILSSLDEKIELNNKMNKTLEAIGQALFKKWFIDNPEREGWGEGHFNDGVLTELIKPGIEKFEGEKIYLPTANISNSSITNYDYKITFNERPSRASMQPKPNTIWFAKMKDSPKIQLFLEGEDWKLNNLILSTGFAGIKPRKKALFYIWNIINNPSFEIEKDNLAMGTTMQAINNQNIEKIRYSIPDENILSKFNELVKSLYYKISVNNQQNQTLAQIRDALLPKLMSGEVRVR